jgi:hypothetical protein
MLLTKAAQPARSESCLTDAHIQPTQVRRTYGRYRLTTDQPARNQGADVDSLVMAAAKAWLEHGVILAVVADHAPPKAIQSK